MREEEQGKLVPRLRFPEFDGQGDWHLPKLAEVLTEHHQISTGKEEIYSVSVHKGLVNQLEHLGRRFAATDTSNYKRVLHGDIVYTKSPTTGFPFGIIKQSLVGKAVIVSPLYGVFSPKNIHLGKLLGDYFDSPANTFNYLYPLVQKGAKNTLNILNDTFLSNRVPLPQSENEQQKIADFLSSIRDLIEAYEERLLALEDYKRGLIQSLFPAPGESVPGLRFPEFEGSGEWVEKPLSAIVRILKGKSLSKADITENGATPCIRYGELYTQYSEVIHKVKSFTNVPASKLVLSVADDVLIPSSGETPEDMASVCCIKASGIAIGGDINILRPKVNGEFLAYYLRNAKRRDIAKISQGSPIVHLYSGQLKNLIVHVPKSLEEQRRIAELLGTVDAMISSQENCIKVLSPHKQGLLQQLFPHPMK